jgi:hypothetical protein
MLKALTIKQAEELIALATRYRGRSRQGSFDVRAAAYADDLENTAKQALYRAIKQLSPAARHEFTALAWIGNGVYPPDEWGAAVRYARANQRDADLLYMIENGPLHEHLACGLARLDVPERGAAESLASCFKELQPC